MRKKLGLNGNAFLHLHHIWDKLIASRDGLSLVNIEPASIPLMESQCLDAALALPFQSGQVRFQNFKVAVAAHVAKRNRALVEDCLKFLRRYEVGSHEGKPEGFAVHGDSVAGHLRFILSLQHFQRMYNEIGQCIDILAAFADIPSVGFIDTKLPARRIDILGAAMACSSVSSP